MKKIIKKTRTYNIEPMLKKLGEEECQKLSKIYEEKTNP